MKTLAVIISGAAGNNLREIEIQPGSSAGDALRALGLTDYLLSKEGSAQAYAVEEDIYAAVNDGDKLRATPVAEVGGFWEWLIQGLGLKPEPEKVVVSQAPARSRATARQAAAVPPVSGQRIRVER